MANKALSSSASAFSFYRSFLWLFSDDRDCSFFLLFLCPLIHSGSHLFVVEVISLIQRSIYSKEAKEEDEDKRATAPLLQQKNKCEKSFSHLHVNCYRFDQ